MRLRGLDEVFPDTFEAADVYPSLPLQTKPNKGHVVQVPLPL